LFERAERQWGAFYAAVRSLADAPEAERTRELERLAHSATPRAGDLAP
jgi:predicted aminopeptidase